MCSLNKLKSFTIIALLAASAILLFDMRIAAASEAVHNDSPGQNEVEEKKIKYWIAPMDPNYVRSEPGKSPMGMDLVPVYEDGLGESDTGTVRIDPVTVQSMGVRTAKVSRGPLKTSIRTLGRVTYDEERVEHIHTKISGWVEQLFVRTTGEKIISGQELLAIYSPELVATEQEYLQALSYRDKVSGSSLADIVKGAESLLQSTKKRLLLLDITPEQIRALEERGEVEREVVLRSQTTGIVINKKVVDGMKVGPGMELYTVADLSRVWVIASVYEYELPFIKVGQDTIMSLPYEPGTAYHGKVTFIYPYLSPKTRTVQVRMEFDNPELKLKPDMYADVIIATKAAENVLLVPSEAILRTGYRNVVITSLEDGKFLPKEVGVGPEGADMTQILSGLKEGETIVTSGQFLIDSESNLKEAINKMLAAQAAGSSPEAPEKDPEPAMQEMNMDGREHIQALIENYLSLYEALLSESVTDVAEQAHIMLMEFENIKAADTEGDLNEVAASIDASTEGLLSGDLQNARDAFKILSRAMTGFIKGAGREDAASSGIKLYFCPMEEEYWMQKGESFKNPYLGENMWICGTEEEF